MAINPQLHLAQQYVEFTNKNIFLTGKAGTGKTTFLKTLKRQSTKRSVVVAPTGVAAINASGVTIHSFFQMPFGPFLPKEEIRGNENKVPAGYTKMSKTKIAIIKSLDLLIIDEISMVRADILDGIDEVLRRYRLTTKPFGGIQLLMIGDIQQLSPVIKEEDRLLLNPYYDTLYFFGSRALQKTDYVNIELKHIYRQSDTGFIHILNKVRENQLDETSLKLLNDRYIPGFSAKENEGYIELTTHNKKAKEINSHRLEQLSVHPFTFEAQIDGSFPEYIFPTHYELLLKEGAQVMFVKNDPSYEKRFYNGKIGVIDKIDPEANIIYVKCTEDNDYIAVSRTEWTNCKYSLNPESKDIEEEIIGRFIQFPLKLAWAITIHKSQGLTFEKAIIDAYDSFAHGQVYVALSRCRSLEGMVLSSPIAASSIKIDAGVYEFTREIDENPPNEHKLEKAKDEFLRETLTELFNFRLLNKYVLSSIKAAENYKTSLLVELTSVFHGMHKTLNNQILKVSKKFYPELSNMINKMNINHNVLQERIRKAAVYFSNKLKHIVLDELNRITIETDNKLVKKKVFEVIDKLYREAHVKKACFDSFQEGFQINEFLNIRAKASIEKTELSKSLSTGKSNVHKQIVHPNLYAKLRQWRNEEALKDDIPVYRVVPQNTLAEIASEMPASMQDLLEIRGIGKRKITTYGRQILELISDYCSHHKISYQPDFEIIFKEKKKKSSGLDTKKISLEMYLQGKSIDEIAAERGFVVSTIQSHLAYYIRNGELDIADFLSQNQIKEIRSAIKEIKSTQLNPLKEALGHKYDYGELKMAVAYHSSVLGK